MRREDLRDAMTQTRASHARLMRTLVRLTDDQVIEPSRLPGWTRGHLLTHIARNADSHVRLLAAAARGETVEQYVGGAAGRAADIEAGATRSADSLVLDVDQSADRLFMTWDQVPERAWDEQVVAIHDRQPAWVCVFSRWRETEIHHVDLDLGYETRDWPMQFVAATLPALADGLAARLPQGTSVELIASDFDFKKSAGDGVAVRVEGSGRALLAWLAGRPIETDSFRVDGELPVLGPWL